MGPLSDRGGTRKVRGLDGITWVEGWLHMLTKNKRSHMELCGVTGSHQHSRGH